MIDRTLAIIVCVLLRVFQRYQRYFAFFFFNDTATTEIYTLSLHDALPIYRQGSGGQRRRVSQALTRQPRRSAQDPAADPHQRSEEHTSELQSRSDLVCRLLLEKKKNTDRTLFLRHSALNHLYACMLRCAVL